MSRRADSALRASGLFLMAALTIGCGGAADTPLARAAESGDRPQIVRLLAEGADPNVLDAGGQTPLMRAVNSGHFKLVGVLVTRGADSELRDTSSGRTALLHAIHGRQMDAARALLNSGADPNTASADGRTPLMMAASYGYQRITRLLLERGADPRFRDSDGEGALERAVLGAFELDHVTVGGCHTETVRHLAAVAPDLELEEGSWPLRFARLKRCGEILELVAPG